MSIDKYRDQLAEALCRWWDDENGGDDFGHRGVEFPCQHCRGEAAALSPVVAQIRADAWDEGWEAAWSPMSMHDRDDGPNPYRTQEQP